MRKSLLLLPLLLLTSCNVEQSKTPYEWCFEYIINDYDYEDNDLVYSYQEVIVRKSDIEWCEKQYGSKSTYEYFITVCDEYNDKFDVYFGGVCFNKSGKNKYYRSEIVEIDCDWVYSIPIERTLVGE